MVTLRLESARGKAFGFGVADVSPYRMKIKGVRRRDAGRGERTMFHVTRRRTNVASRDTYSLDEYPYSCHTTELRISASR